MRMENYKNRVFDSILRDALDAKGAVLIEGAKWCGKTTTAEQIAKSVIYLNNPKLSDQYLMTAQTNPQRLLEGDNPRLIDEWQTAPELWDAIRFDVDHSGLTRNRRRKFAILGQDALHGLRCGPCHCMKVWNHQGVFHLPSCFPGKSRLATLCRIHLRK